MQINEQTLEKLRGSRITSEVIIDTLQQICDSNNKFGAGDTQIHLDYQDAHTVVEPDDVIPFITVGLRCGIVEEKLEVEE